MSDLQENKSVVSVQEDNDTVASDELIVTSDMIASIAADDTVPADNKVAPKDLEKKKLSESDSG